MGRKAFKRNLAHSVAEMIPILYCHLKVLILMYVLKCKAGSNLKFKCIRLAMYYIMTSPFSHDFLNNCSMVYAYSTYTVPGF